jgi:hypothetical protein
LFAETGLVLAHLNGIIALANTAAQKIVVQEQDWKKPLNSKEVVPVL